MKRVVITGMGVVTPIGIGVPAFLEGLREGRSGIGPITHFDTAGFKATLAAEVKAFTTDGVIDKKEARRMDRYTQLAVVAAEEAMKDAAIEEGTYDPFDISVLVTSGIGGLNTMEENMKKMAEKGPGRVSPFFIPMNILNMAAGEISIRTGAMGASFAPVSACASGTHSIGEGFRAIKHGYAKVAVVGGTEGSITPMAVAGFSNMKALNETTDATRASIPFDKDRKGFVMGEGAGVLILEELESALARGATIYGEVAGYGATSDSHHITAPHPEALGAKRAMELALAEAGLAPEAIGYVNAHGTSTPMNDELESMAVEAVLGTRVPVSSTKSMTGHLLGAAGAVEAVASVLAMREGFIPPTIGTAELDEAVGIHVVTGKALHQPVAAALSNSLGFGGHNATLAFKRWEGK